MTNHHSHCRFAPSSSQPISFPAFPHRSEVHSSSPSDMHAMFHQHPSVQATPHLGMAYALPSHPAPGWPGMSVGRHQVLPTMHQQQPTISHASPFYHFPGSPKSYSRHQQPTFGYTQHPVYPTAHGPTSASQQAYRLMGSQMPFASSFAQADVQDQSIWSASNFDEHVSLTDAVTARATPVHGGWSTPSSIPEVIENSQSLRGGRDDIVAHIHELLDLCNLEPSIAEDESINPWPLYPPFPLSPGHSDYQTSALLFPGELRPKYSPSSSTQHRRRSRDEPVREQASRDVYAEALNLEPAVQGGVKRRRDVDNHDPIHKGYKRRRQMTQCEEEPDMSERFLGEQAHAPAERQAGDLFTFNWPTDGQ